MPSVHKGEEIMAGMEKFEMVVLKACPLAGHFLSLEQQKQERQGLCVSVTWIHEATGLVFFPSMGLP